MLAVLLCEWSPRKLRASEGFMVSINNNFSPHLVATKLDSCGDSYFYRQALQNFSNMLNFV